MTATHTKAGHRAATRASRRAVPMLALALVMGLSGCKMFGGKEGPKTPTVGERVPILSRIESGAEVDPTLAAVSVVLPPEEVNTAFAQGGGDADKSYGHLALAPNPSKLWTAQIEGSSQRARLAAAPVVGDGRLFVMDTKGEVHAFDAETGAQVWSKSFSVSGDNASSLFGGGVSFDVGKLYVTTGLGEVAALDAADGKQVWTVKPAGPLRGAPTVAFNAIYVMTQDNQIFALNSSDGTVLWNESGSLSQ